MPMKSGRTVLSNGLASLLIATCRAIVPATAAKPVRESRGLAGRRRRVDSGAAGPRLFCGDSSPNSGFRGRSHDLEGVAIGGWIN